MTSQKSAKSIDMASDIKLTRKKYSFNLPLSLASRLEALCELHPYKTRTQVIADLIGIGLAEVELGQIIMRMIRVGNKYFSAFVWRYLRPHKTLMAIRGLVPSNFRFWAINAS